MPKRINQLTTKKLYNTPKLSKHGTVDAITLGGKSGSLEGKSNSNSKKT